MLQVQTSGSIVSTGEQWNADFPTAGVQKLTRDSHGLPSAERGIPMDADDRDDDDQTFSLDITGGPNRSWADYTEEWNAEMLGRVVCMLALIAIVPGFVIWGIADHTPLTRTSDYCVVGYALIAAGTALAVGCGHGLLRRPHFFYLSQHRVGVARLFGHLLADPILATAVSMYANKADAVNWMVAAFALSAAATYFVVEHAAYRVHQRRRESLKSHDPQERRSWGCYAIATYLAMVFFFVLVWWTALDGPADLHEAEQMEGRPWWQLIVKSTARALGTASIVITVFRALNLLVSVLCVYSKTEQRLG